MGKSDIRLKPDKWSFNYVSRNLCPHYVDTKEMLDYLCNVAQGGTSETPGCFGWDQVVEKIENIIAHDKRYDVKEKAKTLLNLIRDICHDSLKHKIKKLL